MRLTLQAALLAGLLGCEPGSAPSEPPASAKPTGPKFTLRIAVVADGSLSRAIGRLAGEWADRGRGAFEVVDVDAAAGVVEAAADSDLVVFPSRLIGELCESQSLRAIRDRVLRGEELRLADVFPAVRDTEIVYGNRVMALPIGCPTPLVVGDPSGALTLPADDRRLALAFLAYAAPHAVHRSRAATLFDPDSFEPRLTAPAFARALDRLAAAAELDSAARRYLVWPTRDGARESLEANATVDRPAGAPEVYNPIAEAWEPVGGSAPPATLLASSGRLVGVTASSRNAAAAFRMVAWLAGAENAPRLSTSSDAVTNCRGSFARRSDPWVANAPDLGPRFASASAQALRSSRVLVAPRLPGADEYLDSLGMAVRSRVEDGAETGEALAAAAEAWRAIGERRGWEAQRAAYLRSVNSSDFEPAKQ